MNKPFFILLIAISIASCKTTQTTTTTAPSALDKNLTAKKVQEQVEKQRFVYNWISGKADIDYQGKPMNIGLSSNIRIRKDSILWMNFKKFGFEVARIKVTKDSFYLIDYFNNRYLVKDLKYIEDKFNLPANLSKIQDIIVGNLVYINDLKKYNLDKIQNEYLLKDTLSKYSSKLSVNTEFRPTSMVFEEQQNNRKILAVCSDYDKANNGCLFSFMRNYDIYTPESGKILAKIEIDRELEIDVTKLTKFEIPSNYTRVDRF